MDFCDRFTGVGRIAFLLVPRSFLSKVDGYTGVWIQRERPTWANKQ